jgi:hypothetical protein
MGDTVGNPAATKTGDTDTSAIVLPSPAERHHRELGRRGFI